MVLRRLEFLTGVGNAKTPAARYNSYHDSLRGIKQKEEKGFSTQIERQLAQTALLAH